MKIDNLGQSLSELHELNKEDVATVENHLENIITSLILNNLHDGNNECGINIGMGTLYIRVFPDMIHYQFEPSVEFQKKVSEAIESYEDPLLSEIQLKIDRKLSQLYKELLK